VSHAATGTASSGFGLQLPMRRWAMWLLALGVGGVLVFDLPQPEPVAAGSADPLPAAAAPFIGMYKAAAEHWKVNWYLLASIHMQESGFGTSTLPGVRSGVNRFGCCAGPMQFNVRDGTWDGHKNAYKEIEAARPPAYPLQQPSHPSPYDSFDAIAAAAHKLSADGADASLYSSGTHRATCAYVGACSEVDNCGGPSEYCQVLPRARAWEKEGTRAEPGVAPVPAAGGWPLSIPGRITSAFGMRDGRPHKGLDIAAPPGTPIVAHAAGRVSLRQNEAVSGGYGNFACVDHGAYESCYAHMIAPAMVTLGQQVSAGQQLGRVGSTGRSTGPHLHFEIRMPGHGRALCPAPYLGIPREGACTAERF
jgi:murein DD-endopeptidase MepM/ murein hydrolase activator NlpD